MARKPHQETINIGTLYQKLDLIDPGGIAGFIASLLSGIDGYLY